MKMKLGREVNDDRRMKNRGAITYLFAGCLDSRPLFPRRTFEKKSSARDELLGKEGGIGVGRDAADFPTRVEPLFLGQSFDKGDLSVMRAGFSLVS